MALRPSLAWLPSLLAIIVAGTGAVRAQVIESRANGPRGGGPGGPGGEERSMTRVAPEGSAPPPSDPHDLSGVWTARGTSNSVLYTLKPEWRGRLPEPKNADFSVPNIGSRQCHPTAYFGQMVSVYPLLITQTPKQVNFLFEENRRTRRIYLDASMPKDAKPAYFGHSVGHWVGDTLVVDTTGTRGLIDFQLQDQPQVHITERMHKEQGGRILRIDVSYMDAEHWATPGTFTVKYNWRPDLSLMELVCEEFSDNYGRGYDSLR